MESATRSDGSARPLAVGYKVGLGVLGAAYVVLALVSAVLGAEVPSSGSPDTRTGLFVGMVTGHFACCSSIPVIVAAVVTVCLRLITKREVGGALLAKVLFWVLLVLVPFEVIAVMLNALRLVPGTR